MRLDFFSGALASVVAAAFIAGVAATPAVAQGVERDVKSAVKAAKRSNPALVVRTDPITGLPTSIRGLSPNSSLGASSEKAAGEPTDADARRVVEAFFASSDLSAAFPTKNAAAKVEALKVRMDPDVAGQRIVNVEQRVNGVPVFGSTGRVIVSPSLGVTALTASLSTVAIESTDPTIEKEKAIDAARNRLRDLIAAKPSDRSLERLRTEIDKAEGRADLVVFDPALMRSRGAAATDAKLAYLVSIDTFRLFVDATSAEVVFFYRDHPSASLRQIYDLASGTAFPGQRLVDDATGERKDPLPKDAELAWAYTGRVAEYFAKTFARKGIDDEDGAPKALESYVRYGDVENAYWCKTPGSFCPKGSVMVFGPSFASSIDVVGHEMTHGVITREADLIYADEPGAVNEALADLFGTLIEFDANNGNGNWVIGEGLPGFTLTTPLRSMANPHLIDGDGNSMFNKSQPYSATNHGQPDHFSEYLSRDSGLCESTNDYFTGCVHFNSGIFNKFAYLVSEGGRHYDVVVNGIGRVKLGRIAYRALTTQFHTNSGLKDAADGFAQACRDLTTLSPPPVDNADCDQLDTARKATGLETPLS